jgi:hypothetical protein
VTRPCGLSRSIAAAIVCAGEPAAEGRFAPNPMAAVGT